MEASDTSVGSSVGWDEAQCTAALAQLEQLQTQIDDLRLAIPRIIEPFHRPPNATTYKLYTQGVLSSQTGLNALKDRWNLPEVQNTFEHAKQSFGANADLSEAVSVPSHGWVEREQEVNRSTSKSGSKTAEDTGAVFSDSDISRIVVVFRKAHPTLKVETNDEDHSIHIRFVASSLMLKFRVTIDRESNGRHKLNAECLGTTESCLAITRCIASRPNKNDLRYLLDMIAAYKIVKGISCDKCSKMLDSAALTPTARRSKQVATADESLDTVWVALHESCLD
ncbi:hypothetical protein COCCADRAFT_33649 [Bipolaris zeicola 26-R-13]|uniref:Uncharacterized protein n=1 Tax=Cochliobolus carbonum (strain 26-R-13) TaxID=930089 RepID=W6YN99_COCC2|nr:uncharacterized protein COCCADRAFT_33649 [Bipolaris zeicola 26-R-13]EUC36999.1 hypothetical protein COCCADRAFT_33649 [Bipolaris zeicola 26-R-13]